jgi:hypothetical protein
MVSTSLQLRLNFLASKEETEGRFVCDLGNGQWDKLHLRTLLPQALKQQPSR